MSQKVEALLGAVDRFKVAFGAPGDYGYETKEGDALFKLYKARAEFKATADENVSPASDRTEAHVRDVMAMRDRAAQLAFQLCNGDANAAKVRDAILALPILAGAA